MYGINMNTTTLTNPESDLFGQVEPTETLPQVMYADIVFDLPMDRAYTYSVPESLQPFAAVGKRVEAPFGKGDRSNVGYIVRLTHVPPVYAIKDVVRVLDEESLLTDQLLRLTRWMADYYLCGWGQVLHAVVPAGVRDQAGLKPTILLEAVPSAELPRHFPTLTPKQMILLKKLRQLKEPIEQKLLQEQLKIGSGPIASLLAKNVIRRYVQRTERHTITNETGPAPERITLNKNQQAVWEPIDQAIQKGGYHSFLLHGVTGSGKTEIYLRAIEEVIRQGREAIVLVPEISLTPQTIERFRGRCGSIAVMHSHLTDSERGAHWRRVAGGFVQVVVGARSAVFAPTRNLGIIIIDEEHENSFKQESTPRYHARDVAVMRARLENVPIVMGSATPALESWCNAERGTYTKLSLPHRVEDRPMPPVVLVDMRHEPKSYGSISPTLEQGMRDALKAGGQVMLLLNRRGFSTHVHCPGCGYVATCRDCDLSMTFHRQKNVMMCHYCGYESGPLTACPQCSSTAIRYQGLGTEKLEDELARKFSDKIIQRMDSDTMSRAGSHARVLDAFRNGLIHILLGTQMIAKGLDFPNVTLVGVINADVGLHLPDFRAAERTFQILAQVAGRAGRGPKGGRVLVQTHTPDHPCIAMAAHHDFLKFANQELAHRKMHGYPPYHRLARLIVRSQDQTAAANFADLLAGTFREAMKHPGRTTTETELRLLGPAEAPVFRLNGYYRFHFQLQCPSAGLLHQVLREVLTVAKVPHGIEFQVDVDPFNMM